MKLAVSEGKSKYGGCTEVAREFIPEICTPAWVKSIEIRHQRESLTKGDLRRFSWLCLLCNIRRYADRNAWSMRQALRRCITIIQTPLAASQIHARRKHILGLRHVLLSRKTHYGSRGVIGAMPLNIRCRLLDQHYSCPSHFIPSHALAEVNASDRRQPFSQPDKKSKRQASIIKQSSLRAFCQQICRQLLWWWIGRVHSQPVANLSDHPAYESVPVLVVMEIL